MNLDLHVSPVSLLSGAQVLALLADGRVAAFVRHAGVMADGQVLDSWAADAWSPRTSSATASSTP